MSSVDSGKVLYQRQLYSDLPVLVLTDYPRTFVSIAETTWNEASGDKIARFDSNSLPELSTRPTNEGSCIIYRRKQKNLVSEHAITVGERQQQQHENGRLSDQRC